MAYLTQVGTNTVSNTNLTAATLVYTFTNTVRIRELFVNVFADQIKGNGDYTVYITVQRAGAGSFYEALKTTKTVATGVTAIYFGSIPITLNATDVMKVYLLGLATDNDITADVIVDVNEEWINVDASGNPTPNNSSGVTTILADYARRTGDYATVAALLTLQGNVTTILTDYARRTGDYATAGALMGLIDDTITSSKFDETTAFPIKAVDNGITQIARVGADGDTLETLSDQIDIAQTDLNNPSQYQADVSDLATQLSVDDLPTVDEINTKLTTEHGTGSWGVVGTGTLAYPYTVTDISTGNPLDGVPVAVYTEVEMTNKIREGITDAFGKIVFSLYPGTYYFVCSKSGYSFTNPDEEIVG